MPSGKSVWRSVLRGGRRLAGLLVLAGFVALFWNLEWRCVAWLAPLAKTQLVPALLAANVVVAGAILLVTALVGRVYCGVLCPLGIGGAMMILGGAMLLIARRMPIPEETK